MAVTVLTATIPGREAHLAQAVESVYAQTLPAERHLISAQANPGIPGPQHSAQQHNALLPAVRTEWVASLGDDDAWLPHHLEALAPVLDDADVVYSWDATGDRPRVDVSAWSRKRLLVELWAVRNVIDGNALYRTSLLRKVGGWPEAWEGPDWRKGGHFAGCWCKAEDHALMLRLAYDGARFACVPQETWVYGQGDWASNSRGL